MNRYRVMIVCGGTGGHLSPGIAVAEGLLKAGHQVHLLISEKEVDSRLLDKYPQFQRTAIPAAPLLLSPIGIFRFFSSQLLGTLKCISLFHRERPQLVMGFGGFTSFGAVVAAAFLDLPVILHEANRKVGRAIRLLKRFAYRLSLPPGVRVKGIDLDRIDHHGFPVRDEIRNLGRETVARQLGISPEGKWLMVLGGSQGASILNQWVQENFESLANDGINIYCLTGMGKGSQGTITTKSAAGKTRQVVYQPFSDNMAAVLSAADLVISRAGAGSIAELTRCHRPSILIPYPHAADNHQQANAEFLESQGGCVVVHQKNLSTLRDEVRDLLYNDWVLEKFRSNLRRLDEVNSRDQIVRDLIQIMDDFRQGKVRWGRTRFLEARVL